MGLAFGGEGRGASPGSTSAHVRVYVCVYVGLPVRLKASGALSWLKVSDLGRPASRVAGLHAAQAVDG